MSWTCPNQTKDNYCELRNKECEPGSDGCVISNKFKFIGDEDNSSLDNNIENKNNKAGDSK